MIPIAPFPFNVRWLAVLNPLARILCVIAWSLTLDTKAYSESDHSHNDSAAQESKTLPKRPQVHAIRSGNWSDSATWDPSRVPIDGDSVLIPSGVAIQYDVESPAVIRILKIAGSLTFRTDCNTELNVGLIRVESGNELTEEGFDCDLMPEQYGNFEATHHHSHSHQVPLLQVGSPNRPIEASFNAKIRLTYCEGMNTESCPAIICCGGRMDFHGAPMARTWLKLAENATASSNEIKLSETPDGWQLGHRIVIPTTDRVFLFQSSNQGLIRTSRDETQTEERAITNIQGNTITIDRPLQYDHVGQQPLGGEVGNLTRNVVIESATPDGNRGHTMYHFGSTGSISYAEFRNLGKRGVLGRYPIHYHLCRDSMRGSSVIGASIHDSENRWLTIHGTDYIVVRDCIGYNGLGHGYFLEDGTEVFNVFDRNLAIQALHGTPLPKQILPYDENEGAGFWWANSLNSFTHNIAAECDQYGYRFEATSDGNFVPELSVPNHDGKPRLVDIRTLPFVRFESNEAHSQRRFAINLGGIRHVSDAEDYRRIHTPGSDLSRIQGGDVGGVGPDTQHPFIIKQLLVWNCHWAFHGGSPNVLIDGLKADGCTYGIFKTRMDGHEYRNLDMKHIDTADIFQPWGNISMSEDYHRYLNPVDDLPPSTVITHYQWISSNRLLVSGTTTDNGEIKEIKLNNQSATPIGDNLTQWKSIIESADSTEPIELQASATDEAGNVEAIPHKLKIDSSSSPYVD